MNKTTHALELAKKALERSTPLYLSQINLDRNMEALAAIREALAEPVKQELNWGANKFMPHEQPVKQEPVMDYERLSALREGEQNKAEDDYFNARPENDTPTLRKMFCQGFERGFHKGLKYAAPVQQAEQEPVAWQPIGTLKPTSDELDILMGDGSILCNVLTQSDGDLWWDGSGIGEKFIDPEYAAVTHWRKHSDSTPPTAALAARQMRDAAVKLCRDEAEAFSKQRGEFESYGASSCAEIIAALPIPGEDK